MGHKSAPNFMRLAGAVKGPRDLSKRKGLSRRVDRFMKLAGSHLVDLSRREMERAEMEIAERLPHK